MLTPNPAARSCIYTPDDSPAKQQLMQRLWKKTLVDTFPPWRPANLNLEAIFDATGVREWLRGSSWLCEEGVFVFPPVRSPAGQEYPTCSLAWFNRCLIYHTFAIQGSFSVHDTHFSQATKTVPKLPRSFRVLARRSARVVTPGLNVCQAR